MNWPETTQAVMDSLALDRHPIGMHYQDDRPDGAIGFKGESGCLIALLKAVEKGKVAAVSGDAGCFGGRFYCGFAGGPREGQAEYVSTGTPGGPEGEHYLKTPELCRRVWSEHPPPAAGGEWLVFQRLDRYGDGHEPEVVIFLARPDGIAGLFFLASYDRGADGVIAPFTSGCGSIVAFPRLEAQRETHRGVLGLFDPSARAVEDPGVLSFAVDSDRFGEMVGNIGESFLQYDAWQAIKARNSR